MGCEVWGVGCGVCGVRCEVLFGCVRACDPKLEDCMETIAFYLFFFASPKKEPKKSSLKKPKLLTIDSGLK